MPLQAVLKRWRGGRLTCTIAANFRGHGCCRRVLHLMTHLRGMQGMDMPTLHFKSALTWGLPHRDPKVF